MHINSPSKDRCTELRQLVSNAYNTGCFNNHNAKEKQEKIKIAFGILNDLINQSLTNYLNHVFTISKITETEDVFKHVILTQCGKEFDQITKYIPSNESIINTISKWKVFNTSDLMILIFQLIDDDSYGFENCGLVNSHWLYYSMNPKAITDLNLCPFIHRFTVGDNMEICKKQQKAARHWQKHINVKSIYYYDVNEHIPCLLLRHLLILNNVAQIYGHMHIDDKQIPILQAIMYQSHKKMKIYDLEGSPSPPPIGPVPVLTPLKLLNARYIRLGTEYFNIVWSNQCKYLNIELTLQCTKDVEKWFNFIEDNCDCSGITDLEIGSQAFDGLKSLKENEKLPQIIKKFASKFVNVKKLRIELPREENKTVRLLWKAVQGLIDKSNGFVELEVSVWSDVGGISAVSREIVKHKLAVNKLVIRLHDTSNGYNESIELIESIRENVEWLKVDCAPQRDMESGVEEFVSFVEFLNSRARVSTDRNVAFPSLKILDISEATGFIDIDMITNFIKLNMTKINNKNKLFVMGRFHVEFDRYYHNSQKEFFASQLVQFGTLCKNIYSLMIDQLTPIDIRISMIISKTSIMEVDSKYCSKIDEQFKTVFNKEKISTQYQEPMCHDFCVPLKKPIVSYSSEEIEYIYEDSVSFEIRWRNAEICT